MDGVPGVTQVSRQTTMNLVSNLITSSIQLLPVEILPTDSPLEPNMDSTGTIPISEPTTTMPFEVL